MSAEASKADVRVLHLRELPKWARVPPLETAAEAEQLVAEAVLSLRRVGVGAEGRARPGREDEVAVRIVEESMFWECDAIVLGSRRLRGFERLSGRGVRERVLRLSALPVLVAPTPVSNGFHSPAEIQTPRRPRQGGRLPAARAEFVMRAKHLDLPRRFRRASFSGANPMRGVRPPVIVVTMDRLDP